MPPLPLQSNDPPQSARHQQTRHRSSREQFIRYQTEVSRNRLDHKHGSDPSTLISICGHRRAETDPTCTPVRNLGPSYTTPKAPSALPDALPPP